MDRENRELRQQAAHARRASKRQAAPFSERSPKSDPKKPGRKPEPNYGRRGGRPIPDPSEIDETHEACLDPDCPWCQAAGTVESTHVDEQYQVDVPQRPTYRRFRVHIGRCASCGRRVQGRHPLQTSDALGVAKSQLGPTAQAAVVHLNKAGGLSYGKIETAFQKLLGIDLTRGGAAQVVTRAGQRCEPTYEALVTALPHQPVVSVDETGWRVRGVGQWLHVFTNAELTCYVIDPHRGAVVPQRVLGVDFAGIMVHDG